MYNPLTTSIVYSRNKKYKPLKLSNGLYRVETIPVGAFVKDNAKTGDAHERIAFEVDDNLLQHWKNTFESMKFNGVEVPMPLNHTEDPESRRATVVDFEIGKNKEGNNSLYTIFKFKDKQAEEALKDAGVSIYVPPKFVDGRGNEYIYPIRHVCLTDYPVIPGMEKMQPLDLPGLPEGAIAASFVETGKTGKSDKSSKKKEKKSMAKTFPPKKVKREEEEEAREHEEENEEHEEENEEGEGGGEEYGEHEEGNGEEHDEIGDEINAENLRQILVKLMGDEANKIPDDKLMPALYHITCAIVDSVNESGAMGEEGEEDEEETGRGPVSHHVEHKETHFHPPGGKNMAEERPPIAAGFISMGRRSRLSEINAAAKDGYITAAVAKRLISDYCSDEALQLAFSNEGDILDNFESTMKLLRSNGKVLKLEHEKTNNDGLELSYSELYGKASNPLLKDAENRAKAVGQA